MFVEMEDEVVYMEEQNEFGGIKGPRPQSSEPGRTRELRPGFGDGPPRRIFGGTPSQKAPQVSNFSLYSMLNSK
jgi:hypothetical protein